MTNNVYSPNYQDINYYSSLADLPEYERLVILNNAPQNAPLEGEFEGKSFFLSNATGNHTLDRKKVLSKLKKLYPDKNWQTMGLKQKGYWSFRSRYRLAIKEEANIISTAYKPFREHNFLRCGAREAGGFMYNYEDGKKRLSIFSCSETTACPECADAKAKEVASRTFQFLKAIAEANDIKRMWFFVFTLPEKYEALPKKKTKYRQKLIDGLKKNMRTVFGLKTRDLLASYCSVHSVGDGDLFRDRVHFHIGVLPVAISKNKKTLVESYRNVDPKEELIDLNLIKQEWLKTCHEAKIPIKEEEINFKAEFVQIPNQWGKMRHRISYDLRGFGQDFIKAVIYHDGQGNSCIRSKDEYKTVDIKDFASRWRFIRKQRDFRQWGILRKKSAFSDLLNISEITIVPPNEVSVDDVIVEREIGKAFCKKKKRVVWEDIIKVRTKDGKHIFNWERGRLSEKSIWWANNKPIPKSYYSALEDSLDELVDPIQDDPLDISPPYTDFCVECNPKNSTEQLYFYPIQ